MVLNFKNMKSLQLLNPGVRVAAYSEDVPAEVFCPKSTHLLINLYSSNGVNKDLEHVRLEDGNVGYVDKVMTVLDLTNLRYLEILCRSPETEVLKLPTRTPMLESLSLESYLQVNQNNVPNANLSFDDWHNCIGSLKKLRFLHIKTPKRYIESFNEEQCTQIFETCSSLRHLRHVTQRSSTHCFLNVLKNKISFNRSLPGSIDNFPMVSLSPSLTSQKFHSVYENL